MQVVFLLCIHSYIPIAAGLVVSTDFIETFGKHHHCNLMHHIKMLTLAQHLFFIIFVLNIVTLINFPV